MVCVISMNWLSGYTTYFKYEGPKLVEIRSIVFQMPDDKTGIQTIYVEDSIDHQMVEVYHKEIQAPPISGPSDVEAYDLKCQEVLKWRNLEYHGGKSIYSRKSTLTNK